MTNPGVRSLQDCWRAVLSGMGCTGGGCGHFQFWLPLAFSFLGGWRRASTRRLSLPDRRPLRGVQLFVDQSGRCMDRLRQGRKMKRWRHVRGGQERRAVRDVRRHNRQILLLCAACGRQQPEAATAPPTTTHKPVAPRLPVTSPNQCYFG